MILIHESTLKN